MESKQNTSTQERKGPRKFSDQSIQVDDSTTMSRQEFANHEILHGRKAQIAGFIVKADSAISNYKLYDVFSEKDGHKCTVYRRFRDFSWLYSQLINQFYGLVIPSLPQKNVLATFDLEGVDYQAERMRQLERFLNILMRKEAICKSKILLGFMTYSNSDFTLLQNEASNSDVAECLRVSAFDEIKHTLLSMIMTQTASEIVPKDRQLNEKLSIVSNLQSMTKDFALNVHKLCNAQTLATKRNASIIQCDADKEPGKGPTTYDDAAKLDGAWFKNQTTDLQLAVEDMVAAFKRRQLLSDKYQAKVKEVSGCSGEKRELKKKEKDKIYEIVQQVVEALCQDLEIELREIFPVVQNTLGVYSKSIGYFLIGRPQSVRVVSSQIN